MSEFKVSFERISEIFPHPNADRLELARVEGMAFQFIVGKDQYKVGDAVIYFPVDSLLTPKIIADLQLEGKLSGKDKNRVKTIKLRGAISQGLVCLPSQVFYDGSDDYYMVYEFGMDVTELLGVTKYEVIEDVRTNIGKTKTRTLPDMVSHYDIEGADRNVKIVNEHLFNEPVFITEKLEGSHCSISRFADGRVVVCSRNCLLEGEDNYWYKGCQNSNLFEAVEFIYNWLSYGEHIPQVVTIRGELVGPGVQGNIYDLKTHHVYVFDIEEDSQPIVAERFHALCKITAIDTVPILSNSEMVTLAEWLGDKTLQQASNGFSELKLDTLREGIVIRPLYDEKFVHGLGRLIIKQRDSIYLSQNDL